MVPARNRAARPSFRLVDIPEDWRRRTVEHAGKRFAPGARDEELPERDIDRLVVILLLDLGSELLLLLRRGGAGKRIPQPFHPGIVGPAEPTAILALAVD